MDENKEMDELFEDETPEESAAEEITEPETEEVDDGEETDGKGDEPAAEGDGKDAPEKKDTGKDELAKIKEELDALRDARAADKKAADARVSALLKSMGYADEVSYWAEKKGITPEAYRKQKSDEEAVAQARQIVSQQKYAKMAAEDLAVLKAAGFIDSDVDHIGKIDNARQYAEYRENKDLSPIEAYAARALIRAVSGMGPAERHFVLMVFPSTEYARARSTPPSARRRPKRCSPSKRSVSQVSAEIRSMDGDLIFSFFIVFSIFPLKTWVFSNNCLHFGRVTDILPSRSEKHTLEFLPSDATSTSDSGSPRKRTRKPAAANIAPHVAGTLLHSELYIIIFRSQGRLGRINTV